MNCKYCKFWQQTTNYGGDYNDGKCSKIKDKLTITLKTGWGGGYVDYIETDEDFGCILYTEK